MCWNWQIQHEVHFQKLFSRDNLALKTSKIQDQTEIEQEQARICNEIADAINTDLEQLATAEENFGYKVHFQRLFSRDNVASKTSNIQDQTEIKQEQTRICNEIADAINTDLEQLARVEETFGFWLSRREETIEKLEDIATYIDSFTKKTSLAKAIGKVIDTKYSKT